MSKNLNTFGAVLALWPTVASAARAFDEVESTVRNWKSADSIPPGKFEKVVAAAKAWEFEGVTMAKLSELYRERWPTGPAAGVDPEAFA